MIRNFRMKIYFLPGFLISVFFIGCQKVELVEIGGTRSAFGHNDLVNGNVTQNAKKDASMQLLKSKNFKDK